MLIFCPLMHEVSGRNAPLAAYVPTFWRSRYTRSGTLPLATTARNCWSLKLPAGRLTSPPTALVAMAARVSATSSPVPKPMMLNVAATRPPRSECALARLAVIAATPTMATTVSATRLLRQRFMRLLRLDWLTLGGHKECDNVTTLPCTLQGRVFGAVVRRAPGPWTHARRGPARDTRRRARDPAPRAAAGAGGRRSGRARASAARRR